MLNLYIVLFVKNVIGALEINLSYYIILKTEGKLSVYIVISLPTVAKTLKTT